MPTVKTEKKKKCNRFRVQNRLSFPEVRKLVETAAPKVVGKTYVAVAPAAKPVANSVAVNTELTCQVQKAV